MIYYGDDFIKEFVKESSCIIYSKNHPKRLCYCKSLKKMFVGGQVIGGLSGNAIDSSEAIRNDGSNLGLYTNDGTKITDIVGTGSHDASHAWSTGGNAVIPTVGIINEHLSELQNKTNIVVASNTTINAQPDVYYRFSDAVDTLTVTLPDLSSTYAASVIFCFTTGTNPNVTFTTTNNATISYFADYSIDANTSYELNVMWNGLKWTVAYGIIS